MENGFEENGERGDEPQTEAPQAVAPAPAPVVNQEGERYFVCVFVPLICTFL